ncbi:MAG: glycosyltransferase family protein [Corynebacteriales bacterium]|nr:glycosyltransferase family protein [Mycobacteriales bacterium]
MTVTAIIQARMSSSRLPEKVLRPLAGRPVLDWVVRAAQQSGDIDNVVVATSEDSSDDALAKHCDQAGFAYVRGSLDDVLDRFLVTLDEYPADTVVRLTADCPMLDPALISHAIASFQAGNVDYLSTVVSRSLPRGLDVEVFSAQALRAVDLHAQGPHRAHVTSDIYGNPDKYRIAGLVFAPDASDLRITLDTPEDAALLEAIANIIGDRAPTWRELVSLLRTRADLVALNAEVRQKEISEG